MSKESKRVIPLKADLTTQIEKIFKDYSGLQVIEFLLMNTTGFTIHRNNLDAHISFAFNAMHDYKNWNCDDPNCDCGCNSNYEFECYIDDDCQIDSDKLLTDLNKLINGLEEPCKRSKVISFNGWLQYISYNLLFPIEMSFRNNENFMDTSLTPRGKLVSMARKLLILAQSENKEITNLEKEIDEIQEMIQKITPKYDNK